MKMKSLVKHYVCSILFFVLHQSNAQTTINQEHQVWAGYMTNVRVSDKWSIWNDTHWVPDLFFLLRTGVTYHFGGKFNVNTTTGYARLWIYPSQKELRTFRPEHRPWGQTTLSYTDGNYRHLFRFRYDARFRHRIANDELIDGYNFNWRLRWMYQVRYYLPQEESSEGRYFFVAANEYLLNVGREINNGIRMDQNRLSLGLGYQLDNVTFQIGYMNFLSKSNGSDTYFMRHTYLFWMFHNFDLRSKQKTSM